MSIVYINLRTIPEINYLFSNRPNKKDSFQRWFRAFQDKSLVAFHVDGTTIDAAEA